MTVKYLGIIKSSLNIVKEYYTAAKATLQNQIAPRLLNIIT